MPLMNINIFNYLVTPENFFLAIRYFMRNIDSKDLPCRYLLGDKNKSSHLHKKMFSTELDQDMLYCFFNLFFQKIIFFIFCDLKAISLLSCKHFIIDAPNDVNI